MGGADNVRARFAAFVDNIKLTEAQRADGSTKHAGVRLCLNSHYYNTSSASANSFLVGSWGKSTAVRPPRDVDVMFVLPDSVYYRFNQRPGNKQSQLLQEVKGVLAATYPTTTMRADGQVVVVSFGSFAVEVAPAITIGNQYWICDTNDGGKYKTVDPTAEAAAVSNSDKSSNGNTRDLIRMMKCWQKECNVPIKSFWLELLAVQFVQSWSSKGNGYAYYDWLVRDFLAYLKTQRNAFLVVPGNSEIVYLSDAWYSRAESAHSRAVKATDLDSQELPYSANEEWQKIFGVYI